MDALAVAVLDISSRELKSTLAFVVTLSISKPDAVKTPDYRQMLVSSSQSTTQNLDTLAVVVPEISSRELRSNLAFLLTFSISKPDAVQTPDYRKMLLSSSQSTTQNLDALAVVVREISISELSSKI